MIYYTLKDYRKNFLRKTQTEFASKMGYTQAYISKLEDGHELSVDFLEKLDATFHYTKNEIIITNNVNNSDNSHNSNINSPNSRNSFSDQNTSGNHQNNSKDEVIEAYKLVIQLQKELLEQYKKNAPTEPKI